MELVRQLIAKRADLHSKAVGRGGRGGVVWVNVFFFFFGVWVGRKVKVPQYPNSEEREMYGKI